MTFRPWTQWTADEPPPDFTDRMVGRLLQEPQPLPRPSPFRRRWVAALALAAVLAGTTAWAMMHFTRWQAPPPAAPPPVELPAVAAPEPAPTPAPRGLPSAEPPEEPPAPPASVRIKPRTPAASASAPVPVPPAASSTRHVVVPRCECGPGTVICTCVE